MNVPFPGGGGRKLTDQEWREFKARAVTAFGEFFDSKKASIADVTFARGDRVSFTYVLTCGDLAELEQDRQGECGAVPPDGFSGMPCALKKGHACAHSSVIRW